MYSVRCRFCDVLLVGREQFIGEDRMALIAGGTST